MYVWIAIIRTILMQLAATVHQYTQLPITWHTTINVDITCSDREPIRRLLKQYYHIGISTHVSTLNVNNSLNLLSVLILDTDNKLKEFGDIENQN